MALPNYQSFYPWDWWGREGEYLAVAIDGDIPPSAWVRFTEDGRPIFPGGFATVHFRLRSNQLFSLPPIKVTIDGELLPVPTAIGRDFEIVVEAIPGIAVISQLIPDAPGVESPGNSGGGGGGGGGPP